MTKHQTRNLPLESVLQGRFTLIEIALAAIVLGLGINLAATGIGAYVGAPYLLGIAVVLTSLGIAVFVRRLLVLRHYGVQLRGIIAFRTDDKVVLRIRGYDFGDKISRIFGYGFAENPALEQQWMSGAPGSRFHLGEENEDKEAIQSKAAKLVEEATEYYILEELSTHLTDYFNRLDKAEENTVQLEREHVPQVLLQNRFLSLFSMAMEDRPAFLDKKKLSSEGRDMKKPRLAGKIVAAGGHGVMYSRFDLVLPKKSTVVRQKSGAIEVSTPRIKLNISVRYDGFSAHLPLDFCESYLKIPWRGVDSRMVIIEIQVVVKLLGLFYGDWEYYKWVDSFLKSLEEDVSFDQYLQRINWSTVSALLRCQQDNRSEVTLPMTGETISLSDGDQKPAAD